MIFRPGRAFSKHLDERVVLGAAPRDDEIAKGKLALLLRSGFHSGEQVADRVGNRLSGEGGGSGDDIFFGDATTGADECVHEFATEIFAAGGLRSFATEERASENFVNHTFEDTPTGGNATIAIVRLLKEALGDSVDNHVAGTGIEGDDVFGSSSGRNRGEVGDAADVLHDASTTVMAIQDVVEKGNQRCAFAASRHVGGSEIGYDGHCRALRKNGALSCLPGAGDLASEEEGGLSLVIESLAVTTDETCANFVFLAGPSNGLGVELAEQDIQAREIGHGNLGVHERQDSATNRCGE